MAKKNKLDTEIEQSYYVQAKGKQISIMDIPKVFKECREAVAIGKTVDQAVNAAVEKYCLKA